MKISDMDSLKIFQKRELCMDGERVLEGNVFQVKGMKKHDAHESDCQAITEYRVKNHFSSVHVNFSIWVPDSGYCCAKTFSNAAKENQT